MKGVSPSGSHKRTSAVARRLQQQEGVKRLTTRTVAASGALRFAFRRQLFGLGSRIYMGKVSY